MSGDQYLNQQQISENIPYVDVNPDHLGSTDTYHETKIINKFNEIDEKNKKLLYKCAINIAIIGAGNRNYGFIRNDDGEVVEIKTVFKDCKFKYDNDRNSKLSDDDLTPRRLTRLLRFHIHHFIKTTNRTSYLWRKYVTSEDKEKYKKYQSICFQGGEHIVDDQEAANFLIGVYKNVDKTLGTSFVVRLHRVFIARGIKFSDNKNVIDEKTLDSIEV